MATDFCPLEWFIAWHFSLEKTSSASRNNKHALTCCDIGIRASPDYRQRQTKQAISQFCAWSRRLFTRVKFDSFSGESDSKRIVADRRHARKAAGVWAGVASVSRVIQGASFVRPTKANLARADDKQTFRWRHSRMAPASPNANLIFRNNFSRGPL